MALRDDVLREAVSVRDLARRVPLFRLPEDDRAQGREALGQLELGEERGVLHERADGAVDVAAAEVLLDRRERHVLDDCGDVGAGDVALAAARNHHERRRAVERVQLGVAEEARGRGVDRVEEAPPGHDGEVDAVVLAHADGRLVRGREDRLELLGGRGLPGVAADRLSLVERVFELHGSSFSAATPPPRPSRHRRPSRPIMRVRGGPGATFWGGLRC